jgi:hypothetical protein
MLTSLNDQIRHCHERAIECALKARDAHNEDTRRHFLALERSWLRLARSYEVSKPLPGFTHDADRRGVWHGAEAGTRNDRGPGQAIVPLLIGKPFTPEMVEEMSKAFDRACSVFVLLPSDPAAEPIAKKIIELTQRGVHGSTQLVFAAVEELGSLD